MSKRDWKIDVKPSQKNTTLSLVTLFVINRVLRRHILQSDIMESHQQNVMRALVSKSAFTIVEHFQDWNTNENRVLCNRFT